jgi:hypothetical protein
MHRSRAKEGRRRKRKSTSIPPTARRGTGAVRAKRGTSTTHRHPALGREGQGNGRRAPLPSPRSGTFDGRSSDLRHIPGCYLPEQGTFSQQAGFGVFAVLTIRMLRQDMPSENTCSTSIPTKRLMTTSNPSLRRQFASLATHARCESLPHPYDTKTDLGFRFSAAWKSLGSASSPAPFVGGSPRRTHQMTGALSEWRFEACPALFRTQFSLAIAFMMRFRAAARAATSFSSSRVRCNHSSHSVTARRVAVGLSQFLRSTN